jgi:predicted LPLAT superfamily acyltransferase
MNPGWLSYRERGSVTAYRLIAWLARVLGRPLARLLLYPICCYYILLSRTTPRASRQYLSRVFGRAASWREMFRHHLWFATSLLDRVYLYIGREHLFDIRVHGTGVVERILAAKQGCLMLSAHLGSYEFVRFYGLRNKLAINMMMYEENAQKFGAIIAKLDARQARRIIPIGRIDALITAKERLEQGELLGILGDRGVSNERMVPARFLGAEALFPAGPFVAASVLHTPVILFVCLYRGGNRYDLHFELLAERIELDRRNSAEIARWAQRYADRLEHYCRLAPYNWYNFYDFWQRPARAAPAAGVRQAA